MFMTVAERQSPPSPARADAGRSPFVRLRELLGESPPGKSAISLAVGLLLCFVAGLWGWLREHERAPHALSSVFAFGAVAFLVMILAGFVPIYLLSYRAQPATVAGPLGDLGFGLLALSGIPTAVCLAAYAALVITLRCLPVWTAWLAIAAALAHDLIVAKYQWHVLSILLRVEARGFIYWEEKPPAVYRPGDYWWQDSGRATGSNRNINGYPRAVAATTTDPSSPYRLKPVPLKTPQGSADSHS